MYVSLSRLRVRAELAAAEAQEAERADMADGLRGAEGVRVR